MSDLATRAELFRQRVRVEVAGGPAVFLPAPVKLLLVEQAELIAQIARKLEEGEHHGQE